VNTAFDVSRSRPFLIGIFAPKNSKTAQSHVLKKWNTSLEMAAAK
jgi:hypothetical protein